MNDTQRPNRHIVLASHPGAGEKPLPIAWGAHYGAPLEPVQIVVTLSRREPLLDGGMP